MSSFPWESSTQAAQRLNVSRRIETGPLAGRYVHNTGRMANLDAHKPHLRREPQPPKKLPWAADGGHPKGKREWEQWQARTVPTLLPPNRSNGPDPLVVNPLSTAHSRLLPAGRATVLHDHNPDPNKKQRMQVYRRKPQGRSLICPDPNAKPPVLLSRFDGLGELTRYKQDHVTIVEKPRYDPICHRYQESVEHFHEANRGKRADAPNPFGKKDTITPVFVSQVARRTDTRLLPDAARGKSQYGHMRYSGDCFLKDPNKFHAKGTYLNNKNYSHSRHVNLGGHALKEVMDHEGKISKFQQHQMDHVTQAIEDTKNFKGDLSEGHTTSDQSRTVPDGQINEFKTSKGVVSDWAVSGDAPEWIVAQARRSGVNSVLTRKNEFRPDDGQINEFNVEGATNGVASDWAVSGDAPDWIRNNISKYDKSAVIERKKRARGVKSTFYNERGEEISDSTVSGDAPDFMVEVNARVDPSSIVRPPTSRQQWHNRSPRKMRGRHASQQSTRTTADIIKGVKVDFDFEVGNSASHDAPQFIASAEVRANNLSKKASGKSKKIKKSPRNVNSVTKRATWENRNVLGGCHGRVALAQKDLEGVW